MSVYAGHVWNLERMRVSVGLSLLFITLQLESCSKFLAVFAAFADSPCAAEKNPVLVPMCNLVSSGQMLLENVRWNLLTMNENLKRSTFAARLGALELQMRGFL